MQRSKIATYENNSLSLLNCCLIYLSVPNDEVIDKNQYKIIRNELFENQRKLCSSGFGCLQIPIYGQIIASMATVDCAIRSIPCGPLAIFNIFDYYYSRPVSFPYAGIPCVQLQHLDGFYAPLLWILDLANKEKGYFSISCNIKGKADDINFKFVKKYLPQKLLRQDFLNLMFQLENISVAHKKYKVVPKSAIESAKNNLIDHYESKFANKIFKEIEKKVLEWETNHKGVLTADIKNSYIENIINEVVKNKLGPYLTDIEIKNSANNFFETMLNNENDIFTRGVVKKVGENISAKKDSSVIIMNAAVPFGFNDNNSNDSTHVLTASSSSYIPRYYSGEPIASATERLPIPSAAIEHDSAEAHRREPFEPTSEKVRTSFEMK